MAIDPANCNAVLILTVILLIYWPCRASKNSHVLSKQEIMPDSGCDVQSPSFIFNSFESDGVQLIREIRSPLFSKQSVHGNGMQFEFQKSKPVLPPHELQK